MAGSLSRLHSLMNTALMQSSSRSLRHVFGFSISFVDTNRALLCTRYVYLLIGCECFVFDFAFKIFIIRKGCFWLIVGMDFTR